ncbi:MAG TPA: hypothetical protein IAC03_07310, partial [Candidatus Coprenecus pullistercoris]|nr:hypothetical protein [Candidatus Coprenecus pullistercoris]
GLGLQQLHLERNACLVVLILIVMEVGLGRCFSHCSDTKLAVGEIFIVFINFICHFVPSVSIFDSPKIPKFINISKN